MDVVGAYRPIFEHRFCDGFSSCFNGEDEGWSNSVIVRCEGGKATVLPCGRSDCDFATQTCENSADETTYICIDKETTTPEPTDPPNTTPPDTTEPPNTTPPDTTETSYTITHPTWSTETTTKADEDYGEEAVDEISNIIDDTVLDADLDAKTLKRVKKAIKNLQKLVKKLLKHSEKLVKKDGCTFEAPGLGPISGGCGGLLDAELNLEAWTRAYGKHCKKDKNSFVDRLISKYLTKSMETINESTGC
ncbi:Oidioi.mRNA.OKI2018_I69.chr2.g5383.t1.cds [Oikopleura dioica]|uniref:Oidioi.mRNA.OKI2018_I69.chr2.g5383.t1.cds n=1 Tax=Oikopleura dioica TaxID=34765 RepID=A0ABN7T4H5_OIKDI|nr:Oidioi.mRNA.OKI2018_I69.chr2.g5383.t1.cds [Oikopleura dioica]